MGCGIWTETGVKSLADFISPGADTTAVSDVLEFGEPSFPEENDSRRMDRYGNQIETAIGDYRIDPRGDIYERHSPDTAVPRPGIPST